MQLTKTQTGLFLALLAGNAIILYTGLQWSWLRLPAALLLTFILPGWAWLSALNWLQTRHGVERLVLVPGVSSLLAALALFLALFLPGPFTEQPALVALNLAVLSGLLYPLVKKTGSRPQKLVWPSRKVLLVLLAILAVAAITRLTRLGYAEFHEDALENMRLIVRAYKGEAYAPFLDSKGPIHWLMPAALWFLNGWLNEGIARIPFALTSLLLIPTVYALGRRMSRGSDAAGLAAAGFVAVNGFFVAYARHVENPSLIVFWGALAMWFACRYYRENAPHFLIWTALLLAIGLIAHPDVLLYLPVFAFLIGAKLWLERETRAQTWRWAAGACLLFAGLAGLFYIPYLLDPNIGRVYQYFGQDRIGEALFYNRLDNLFDQDKLYSTHYHAPVLVILLLWLLAKNFLAWHRRRGGLLLAGLVLAMAAAAIWPNAWLVGRLNLAFIPYALLTLAVLLLPRAGIETKTLFLWFSLPMWALTFLAKDAADHIQIAYPAWALLAAIALLDVWRSAASTKIPRPVRPAIRPAIVLALAAIAGLILFYQYLTFDSPVTTYWQAKRDSAGNPASLYNRLYGSIPRPRKLFSNPRLSGWKAVGYLWETGVLNGDFRSINESFAVPIWYTFQTPRSCYQDPQNYWVRRSWNGWPKEEQELAGQGYVLTHVIRVDGDPKLHLYQKNAPPAAPEIIDVEAYRQKFDMLATPARFAREEPVNHPTSFNFGDKLLLLGYNLPPATARAGSQLPVTVYWQALAPMDVRYRGFVHLVGPNGSRWGQHDDDPACRLLTTDMRPGQRASRQFRLPVNPDTPPGTYNIVFGLYHPDTLERLPIWDNLAGQNAGDSLILGQVQVK